MLKYAHACNNNVIYNTIQYNTRLYTILNAWFINKWFIQAVIVLLCLEHSRNKRNTYEFKCINTIIYPNSLSVDSKLFWYNFFVTIYAAWETDDRLVIEKNSYGKSHLSIGLQKSFFVEPNVVFDKQNKKLVRL